MSNSKSNFPNAVKPNVKPGEVGEIVRNFESLWELPPVHKNEPEEAKKRISDMRKYYANDPEHIKKVKEIRKFLHENTDLNEKIKIGFNESNLPFLLEDDKFFTIVMPIVLEK